MIVVRASREPQGLLEWLRTSGLRQHRAQDIGRRPPSARVRCAGAFELRPAAGHRLVHLFEEVGRVRAEAVRGLALLGGSPPWQALLELLHDEHPLARAFAATRAVGATCGRAA